MPMISPDATARGDPDATRIRLSAVLAAIGAALLLAASGCIRAGGEPTEAVEIGAIYNLSGAQAGLDSVSLHGARLAIAEINRDGGVLGRPVELVTADGGSDPGQVAAAAEAMLEAHPRVTALMGLSDTDQVLAAGPVAARHGLVFLTSGATSPELPAQVPKFLFLACFGDNVQAAAAAEWAFNERKVRRVAILANDTMSYTRLLRGYFTERFIELGGRVVSTESYGPGGLEAAAGRLPAADLVYAPVAPDEVVPAIRALRAAGVRVPIVGGDGYDLGEVWQANPDISGVYFTTHAYLGADSTDPRIQTFRSAYAAAYAGRSPDAFAALGYDAALLLVDAIGRAGSDAPEAVRTALADYQGFEGVTGRISFASGTRIPSKTVSILEVEAGAVRLNARLAPKRTPPP